MGGEGNAPGATALAARTACAAVAAAAWTDAGTSNAVSTVTAALALADGDASMPAGCPAVGSAKDTDSGRAGGRAGLGTGRLFMAAASRSRRSCMLHIACWTDADVGRATGGVDPRADGGVAVPTERPADPSSLRRSPDAGPSSLNGDDGCPAGWRPRNTGLRLNGRWCPTGVRGAECTPPTLLAMDAARNRDVSASLAPDEGGMYREPAADVGDACILPREASGSTAGRACGTSVRGIP